jgi:hypothetical protein
MQKCRRKVEMSSFLTTLPATQIAWFPANATSVLQPMDMDVIYTFKQQYRRFLMQSLILNIEEADRGVS